MKQSRAVSTTAIKLGEKYDPSQMRLFVQHVERVTSEVQRIQQLLSGGQSSQVLTKTAAGDYLGTWSEPATGGFPEADYIVTIASPDLPNARVLVAGDNITFDLSTPGELKISAAGSSGGGVVDSVQPGPFISVDDTDPANPIVGLDGAAQADLDLAASAVQPSDLAAVAFDGLYDSLVESPPYYRLIQTTPDVAYTVDQFKRGQNIIGVRYSGTAIVRLPHELPIEKIISVKDEAGSGDITVYNY